MEEPSRQDYAAGNTRKGGTNSRFKRLLIMLGLVVVGLAAVYFVGRSQGRSEVAALEARLQEAEAELAVAQANARLTEALNGLYRAAAELDARNFGTANEHLDMAAGVLGRLDAATLNMDPARLKSLQADVAGFDLTVAEDLEAQRTLILELSERLRSIIRERAPADAR